MSCKYIYKKTIQKEYQGPNNQNAIIFVLNEMMYSQPKKQFFWRGGGEGCQNKLTGVSNI